MCSNGLGLMIKMAATPYMVKTFQKSSSPEPDGLFITLGLDMLFGMWSLPSLFT